MSSPYPHILISLSPLQTTIPDPSHPVHPSSSRSFLWLVMLPGLLGERNLYECIFLYSLKFSIMIEEFRILEIKICKKDTKNWFTWAHFAAFYYGKSKLLLPPFFNQKTDIKTYKSHVSFRSMKNRSKI